MVKMLRNLCIFIILGVEMSLAQRPSFAGIRPPGGLNQKDKYLGTQNTAVENLSGVSIATRFGEEAVAQKTPINLPFGASQKPPVGVPLVLPVNSFVPLSDPVPVAPSQQSSTTAATSVVGVANRFGGSNDATIPLSGTAGVATAAARPAANALPIDARGDQAYVNHLNSLPEDQRPFWFLNYQAIEALRNSSRPNVNAVENRGSFFAG
ncbi:hypothetical protein KR215_009099 [Drosophila sulfurigaster]|uniref:uncharacterized protein LOC132791712 n=1 Tax=Drosophila nasuta TaxID=42062 RepID=UPI00295EEBD8|nr:uncharacterized protein LOC132791712 [Drosophila nasuta]KAH8388967.1 hypothetical protein KR215_009099 [Drosophila sulfurigaster]